MTFSHKLLTFAYKIYAFAYINGLPPIVKKTVKYIIHTLIVSILLFNFCLTPCLGQIEVVVKFNSEKDLKTKDFKFSFQNLTDTILVFDSTNDRMIEKKTISTLLQSDTVTGLFAFAKNKIWNFVEYGFKVDTNNLKRIDINLYFATNDIQTEFLQDFTVDKIYKTNSVSIQSKNLKIGSEPIFMLTSNSDTTFWGASLTNHFYGTIKNKIPFGWYDFSGSYCMSTVPEKALTKANTVISWIPSYNPANEYKIKRSGTYKYIVVMGLERFSDGIPTTLINNGQTRKRTRIFCEIETEFTIE